MKSGRFDHTYPKKIARTWASPRGAARAGRTTSCTNRDEVHSPVSRPVAQGPRIQPSVSPDGKWLFFTSERGVQTEAREHPLRHDEFVRRTRGILNGVGQHLLRPDGGRSRVDPTVSHVSSPRRRLCVGGHRRRRGATLGGIERLTD